LAVRCTVQKSRLSSNVKVKGQGHSDKKNEKVQHFVREWSSVLCQFYAGGKISACCLV